MGYNYASAFLEIDPEIIKAASMVAVMNYREEFPDAGYVEVVISAPKKALRVTGGRRARIYTFEELGFKV